VWRSLDPLASTTVLDSPAGFALSTHTAGVELSATQRRPGGYTVLWSSSPLWHSHGEEPLQGRLPHPEDKVPVHDAAVDILQCNCRPRRAIVLAAMPTAIGAHLVRRGEHCSHGLLTADGNDPMGHSSCCLLHHPLLTLCPPVERVRSWEAVRDPTSHPTERPRAV